MNWYKKFMHMHFGRHYPGRRTWNDGVSDVSFCAFCFKKILKDSANRWFIAAEGGIGDEY